ncbi:hypothetical protein B0H66DRAFT_620547 [Apodospora peruviana]|uniref:Uncharacterized protein n=1 Tax=Apodospora peruviana TaxID=516989 RepID=A0AAE0ICW1_9PEZI|nr:hypothetical protein B0H66DRAFT_620547 [Apodospora peruviana]
MNQINAFSDVYVQSYGPCVVCDGSMQATTPAEQQHQSTVHPSCLSRASPTGSEDNAQSAVSLPDGSHLWLCSNCDQLQCPSNFPTTYAMPPNLSDLVCYDCIFDEECADLTSDFGLIMGPSEPSDGGSGDSINDGYLWMCANCEMMKPTHSFSLGINTTAGDTGSALCNDCINQGSHYKYNNYNPSFNFNYDDNAAGFYDHHNGWQQHVTSQQHQNSPFLPQPVQLNNGGIVTVHHQHNTTETARNNNAPPPKRKQTRRPKKPRNSNNSGNENNPSETEPVIQWISRRDPLPPNVCSRCRCRYARPGKKQCQHCAYDYRGTRDHRASQGLCITCAEPLETQHNNAVGINLEEEQQHQQMGMTDVKPRRSCKACREKNRLKKAADKVARQKAAATASSGRGGEGGLIMTEDVDRGVGKYVYRSGWPEGLHYSDGSCRGRGHVVTRR